MARGPFADAASQFLQSKKQSPRGTMLLAARNFFGKEKLPMSAMSFLKEHVDSEAKSRVRQFERDAKAGCNCDRWGHPCPKCAENERGTAPSSRTTLSVVRAVDQPEEP
jgi:hypothetical protein